MEGNGDGPNTARTLPDLPSRPPGQAGGASGAAATIRMAGPPPFLGHPAAPDLFGRRAAPGPPLARLNEQDLPLSSPPVPCTKPALASGLFAARRDRLDSGAMTDPVLFDVNPDGVATISLNRPERRNAMNMDVRDLLWTYLEACRDMPDVRAIVFRGEGTCFSAGADISEFGSAPSVIASRHARHDRDVWDLLLNHRCVTVARMHGYCYGAGLELPLCCDVRVASEDAQFALPEVTLGYIPSAGGTQTLPRRVPAGVAAHLVLTGEPVGASDALRWGLVDRVVPPADLDATVREEVARLLALSPGVPRPRVA